MVWILVALSISLIEKDFKLVLIHDDWKRDAGPRFGYIIPDRHEENLNEFGIGFEFVAQ